ncbi:MAG: Hsp20/alpha crystallin family protein [Fermentimonas sp.]|nr:Hsp20/alpha crystallin family protein [Fermentimonas sp.]
MAIIRRTSNWLPGVFNDFFGNEWMENSVKSSPAINIQQNDKGFKVEVAAPGMTKEDCVVRLDENNNLVISFEKKTEAENNTNGAYLRREFSYSQFQRTMLLPDNIDKENISAEVKDGVLSVLIPTIDETEKVSEKLIEIK